MSVMGELGQLDDLMACLLQVCPSCGTRQVAPGFSIQACHKADNALQALDRMHAAQHQLHHNTICFTDQEGRQTKVGLMQASAFPASQTSACLLQNVGPILF